MKHGRHDHVRDRPGAGRDRELAERDARVDFGGGRAGDEFSHEG
jgi:hypothetical protein